MRWAIRIGRPFGIPVELHVTFLLFVVWIAVALGLSAGDLGRALTTLVLVTLVFGCVLLHELGHALAARRYGIRTRSIVLLPIGGVAFLERMPEKPLQEIVVAVAGPLVNVAIAAGLAGLLVALRRDVSALDFGSGMIESLLAINVWMVLFNLIPAFPMDGGRVLRAVLALRLNYARATRIASVVGQAIALLFGVAGLVGGQPMLLFVALFVFLAAGEEHALVQTRTSISGLPVHAAMLTRFVTLDSTDPLRRAVELLMAGSQAEFPVVQGRTLIGVLTRSDLARALQQHGADAPVGDVVPRDESYADPHEPLDQAIQRMRERGRAALPVLQHGELVGLITPENVSDLLLVRQALKRWQDSSATRPGPA